MKFTYYTDPGHGWIRVSRALLAQHNLLAQVSGYSYQSHDGLTVYLEEDCDASLLARALGGGQLATTRRNSSRDSFIRRLPRFAA